MSRNNFIAVFKYKYKYYVIQKKIDSEYGVIEINIH